MGDRSQSYVRESNCSKGVPVEFYWRDTLSVDENDHVSAAVDAVFDALSSSATRRWNPWARGRVRGEIRDLIDAARAGEAVPIEHVKSLRGGRDDMFELRFQDINVTDDIDGKPVHSVTNARLNHVEPLVIRMGFLGINAFEKPQNDTGKTIQDGYIDRAEQYFHATTSQRWGVNLR